MSQAPHVAAGPPGEAGRTVGSWLAWLRTPTGFLVAMGFGVLLLYANTLGNGYHLDDFYRIANNPEIRYVGNPLRHFKDPTTSATLPTIVQYRPLMPLTLSLGRALLEPLGVPSLAADHIGNIALHIIISALCYAWFDQLLSRCGYARAKTLAMWAALLYAVHPVAGVPVNYLCARDLLCMQALALGALVSWGRFREAQAAGRNAGPWLAASLGCMAFSLCAKQNTAVLPLVLLAYELMIWRRSPAQAQTWMGTAMFAAIVAGFAFFTIKVIGFSDLEQLAFKREPLEYPATMARIHWSYYLRNAIWPFAMRPLPDLEPAKSVLELGTVLGALGIIGTLGSAVRLHRRAPLVAFCIWAYWIMFAVTSSVRPFRFIAMDYRQVPSLPYLMLLLVLAVDRYVAEAARRGVLVTLAAYFAISSFGINFTWKSEESLWGNAVRLGTRSQGQVNYALSQRSKNPEAARAHLLQSLDEGENNIFSLINLGLVEMDLGREEVGLATIRRATQVAPGRSITHYWYARGLARVKRDGEAIAAAKRAAELEPQNSRYTNYAARLLLNADRVDEAEAQLDAATRLDAESERIREAIAMRRAG